jgi:hypothetical protein
VTAPTEQSESVRSGLPWFRIIRYTLYAVLLGNLLYYLWEDLIAFRYVDPNAPLLKVFEAFAVTIDYVAWMVLILLFELETDFIPEEKFKGALKWTFNGLLIACYLVIVYAFYGYYAALADFYKYEAFPPEEVCSLVEEDYAYVTMEVRVIRLTQENCGEFAQDQVYKHIEDKVIAAPGPLAASIKLSWIDVINSGGWLLVVLFMEWEVMLQLRGALSRRRLITFKTIKGALYLILLADAIYWNIYGAFIDYWDAYLWLFAFVLIDLNIFQQEGGSGEGGGVPSPA